MKAVIYAAFAALVLSLAAAVYLDNVENDLEQGIIRLHIIANSDSDDDQAVKLKVRDAILQSDMSASPNETAQNAADIAEEVLSANGFDYGARGEFVKMSFPSKQYDGYSFPAGDYRAVRVILGDGSGHNWWCVLYPPVCMTEDAERSDAVLRESVSEETFEIVTGNKTIKFKSVELFYKIKKLLTG